MPDLTSRLLAAVLGGALLLAGCGDQPDKAKLAGVESKRVASVSPSVLPRTLLGLSVAPEQIGEALKGDDRTYVDAVSLFSLRRKKLVMATLQVGRLLDQPEYRTDAFRLNLVTQLAGGNKPAKSVVEGVTVYQTRGSKQSLVVWFQDRYQLVMSIREDYTQPRTLVRAAVRLKL